jgi:uncharacterized protein (DUF433 family)
MKRSRYNPLEVPTYGTPDAARYLHLPYQTLRYWTVGTNATSPIVHLDPETQRLSFMDLVECWVLASLRQREKIPLPNIRDAVETLREKYKSVHPLAEREFETDGVDLFIWEATRLINLSKHDQYDLKEVMQAYLHRIDRDVEGIANRLYPFTRKAQLTSQEESPRLVVIDPTISFGRPVLKGTGVSTAFLTSRFRGGDPLEMLAKDYGCNICDIEEAIQWEQGKAA